MSQCHNTHHFTFEEVHEAKLKLNETRRQKLEQQTSWQEKHAELYTDLPTGTAG